MSEHEKESIKYLDYIINAIELNEAPFLSIQLITDIRDIINRKDAEIERLQKQLSLAEECIVKIEDALYRGGRNDWAEEAIEEYNNIAKEMEE